jgi:S-adenosyl-L-methionine hydrolase (adenosine-forming)
MPGEKSMNAPITILTDFGIEDPFVGIMKGVIAQIAPGAPTIDLTHQIPSGDLLRAAINLWQSVPYFPTGSIFLCVVDPGVGSARKPVLVKSTSAQKQVYFVGPNNGLFSFILNSDSRAWEIKNPGLSLARHSYTFHGRDIFAPAAAHAWMGRNLADFGPAVGLDDLVRLPQPRLEQKSPSILAGETLFTDRFGNILTSLGRLEWQGEDLIRFDPWIPGASPAQLPLPEIQLALPSGEKLRLVRTFADLPEQECAALIGSSGLVEIVVNRGSAAEKLKLDRGSIVSLHLTQNN